MLLKFDADVGKLIGEFKRILRSSDGHALEEKDIMTHTAFTSLDLRMRSTFPFAIVRVVVGRAVAGQIRGGVGEENRIVELGSQRA